MPLTDHLFMVRGENNGRFPRSHSFYVRDDVCALIDTGCGGEVLAGLVADHRVDMVINSHGHPDHSAGNWRFADVPLFAPLEGAESHGRLELLARRFAEELAEMWLAYIVTATDFRDRQPTDLYVDRQGFDFGKQRLLALHTPGHTADHYCLFDEHSGVLLSFDIDLTSFGPWYGHRESDLGLLRRSLALVAELDARTIASSHRDPLCGAAGQRALADFTAIVDQRSQRIVDLIGSGASRAELVAAAPIYGGHPYATEILAYWEGLMIDDHLAELIAAGTVVAVEGGYVTAC